MTRQDTAPAGKSSATGSAVRVPSTAAPPDPADLAAGLDAAAERLREEKPPADESEEEPPARRRGLLRRRR
jgi:hypothetical protein